MIYVKDMGGPIEQGMADFILLKAGELTLELAPWIGGSLASFQRHGSQGIVDLMRPMTGTARVSADPAGATMFPMVPYANRIAGDQFDFEGNTYQFRQLRFGGPSSIHGSGWHSEWTVRCADTQSAELSVDHLSPDEPYSYSAFQYFRLSEDRLMVTIGVTHRGERPLPYGCGLHPFWVREPDATIRFRSTHLWLEGPDNFPTERIATPPELDFYQARPVPHSWRNHCYGGWDGHAEITFPHSEAGLRIEAGPLFRHLMLYCNPRETYFCLEPQTHASGALNRVEQNDDEDLNVIVLKPGESIEETISFIHFSV